MKYTGKINTSRFMCMFSNSHIYLHCTCLGRGLHITLKVMQSKSNGYHASKIIIQTSKGSRNATFSWLSSFFHPKRAHTHTCQANSDSTSIVIRWHQHGQCANKIKFVPCFLTWPVKIIHPKLYWKKYFPVITRIFLEYQIHTNHRINI